LRQASRPLLVILALLPSVVDTRLVRCLCCDRACWRSEVTNHV
jgi:hypothetical protein